MAHGGDSVALAGDEIPLEEPLKHGLPAYLIVDFEEHLLLLFPC